MTYLSGNLNDFVIGLENLSYTIKARKKKKFYWLICCYYKLKFVGAGNLNVELSFLIGSVSLMSKGTTGLSISVVLHFYL